MAFAAQVGLDIGVFNACRVSDTTRAVIDGDLEQGAALKVAVTPTFFLGTVLPGKRVQVTDVVLGAKPIAEFRTVLDRLLAR